MPFRYRDGYNAGILDGFEDVEPRTPGDSEDPCFWEGYGDGYPNGQKARERMLGEQPALDPATIAAIRHARHQLGHTAP